MMLLLANLPDTLWVSGSFVKDGPDGSVAGYFYMHPGERTVLNVVRPIHQIMIFRPDTLIIYYPDEKRLFYIRSGYTLFSGGIQSSQIGDKNLKRMGFMFVGDERKGDTTVKVYKHPDTKIKVALFTLSGKVVGFRTYDPNGSEVVRVDFEGVREIYRGFNFPSKVVIRMKGESKTETETFTYYSVRVLPSSSVPDYARSFKPPKDARITYKGWD